MSLNLLTSYSNLTAIYVMDICSSSIALDEISNILLTFCLESIEIFEIIFDNSTPLSFTLNQIAKISIIS